MLHHLSVLLILGGQAGEEEKEDRPCQAPHPVQPSLRECGAYLWKEEGS